MGAHCLLIPRHGVATRRIFATTDGESNHDRRHEGRRRALRTGWGTEIPRAPTYLGADRGQEAARGATTLTARRCLMPKRFAAGIEGT